LPSVITVIIINRLLAGLMCLFYFTSFRSIRREWERELGSMELWFGWDLTLYKVYYKRKEKKRKRQNWEPE